MGALSILFHDESSAARAADMFLRALGLGVASIAAAGAAWFLQTVRLRRSLPPGPFPYPFTGNFDLLAPPHRGLQRLHATYGPLITVWMGQRVTIVVGSPETVKQTHKDQQESFQHRVLTDFAKISLHADADGGRNVALAGGKYWKKSRRIFVKELMSNAFIKKHAIPAMSEEITSSVCAIRELNEEPFDPHDHLQRLSLNIVFRLTYSLRFDRAEMAREDSRFKQLMKIINTVVKIGGTNVRANYIPILKVFNRGLKEKQREIVGARDAILFDLLEQHRRNLDPSDPKDFLDVLLTRQQAEGLSDREVMLIAWEFITAGTDTTSATMHWMTLLLANHPEVQRKAWEELDRVTGGEPVDVSHQASLPYTNAVWKEAMRWMPVVPMMVPYQASADVHVTSGGRSYTIKKGTQVLVNGFNMQRDPANWTDPEAFNPERFLSGPDADIELRGADAPNDPHHLKFLPMGTGRRACAGYALAKVELFLQAAALIQSFEWSPPSGVDRVEAGEQFGIAVSPTPFKVVARYRSHAVNDGGFPRQVSPTLGDATV